MKLTLEGLEAEFRRLANDESASPTLWTHDEIVRYANDTLVDAVERGRLIEDESTPTLCRIPVKARKAMYDLSPLILSVTRARLSNQKLPLQRADPETLDRDHPAWDGVIAHPFAFIERPGRIQLVWAPMEDDVLLIAVKRLPKCMVEPDDCPEIEHRLHYRLIDGMLARAYMKFDAEKETYDPKKAERHEAAFTRSFGEKLDANVQRKRRAHRPRVTKPNRYA